MPGNDFALSFAKQGDNNDGSSLGGGSRISNGSALRSDNDTCLLIRLEPARGEVEAEPCEARARRVSKRPERTKNS